MNIAQNVIMFGGVCYRYAHEKDADKVNPLEALTNGLVAAVKNFKVEDVNVVPPLVPRWMLWLTYPLVHSQVLTFFVKQGCTMERSITPDFQVPAASIQIFLTVSIILFVATYDWILAPLIRAFTGKSNAITSLQKIGGGIFVSAITMVLAGLVENRRLKVAQEFGLVNDPNVTVPMVIWWLIPQYILSGLALVLTKVGLQEFFYDPVPNELRNLGLSLYSSIFGKGDIFNVFLISVIQMVTSAGGQEGWLANNMNQGHLDYFYWFLAGLSAIELAAFLCFAKSYEYNNQGDAPM
ncbi:protein NRT1/ PTR FAMILY 5.10-like [Papaver somniferum]|uniref:protein NRT1/ PTR FAMILY 5.10-like n=1 Tax=Papaver somniferum TaxID=3469 RepID=UPI000E6FEC62|nr:protein NRT1/ PTR FAMILY 5.10-like [Papaver somniferum]